jgi:hypothetical protein
MKKLIIIILVLALFSFFFCKWFFNQPCDPPEKPDTVPITAVWKGDCDGGVWIDLVSIKNNKFRFRIYHDWDGEILMDSDFVFEEEKYNELLDNNNWDELVCCYTHSIGPEVGLRVVLRQKEKKITLHLISIYPAYGGSDWEVIKQKYDL